MSKFLDRKKKIIITCQNHALAALKEKVTGINITPFKNSILKNKQIVEYSNLWAGNFVLELTMDDKKILENIDTREASNNIFKENYSIEQSEYMIPKKFKFRKIENSLSHFWLKYSWKYLFKTTDIFMTVCSYLEKIAKLKTKRTDIKIVPIGIDKNDLPLKLADLKLKKPSICIIQNHQIQKKSEALISFENVVKALPNITFYISRGLRENQNNKNTKMVIDTLGKYKNVIFEDINKSNKYDYLSNCDLYVLRSGLDCTPATVLEAGLAGKPVIASAVGGIPEMIVQEKTGWTIKNSDADKWVEIISSLIKNNKLLSNIGKANHNHILDNYEINLIADKLLKSITEN